MNDQNAEQLSALLDGELGRDEQNRTVSRLLSGDASGLGRFGRYRLIGDVMRGESAILADTVRDRVAAAIADEPTVLAPRRPALRWAKPAAGLAVAASVAVAAVFMAPALLQQPGDPQLGPAVVQTPPASDALRLVTADAQPVSRRDEQSARPAGQWETLDAELGERLNRLVIEHHEFGGRTGINGPVAHIGLVNYAGR